MIMKFLRIFHESFKFSNFRLVKYSSIETFSRTSPESLIKTVASDIIIKLFANFSLIFQIFKFSPTETFIFQNFLSHFSNIQTENEADIIIMCFHKFSSILHQFLANLIIFQFFGNLRISIARLPRFSPKKEN